MKICSHMVHYTHIHREIDKLTDGQTNNIHSLLFPFLAPLNSPPHHNNRPGQRNWLTPEAQGAHITMQLGVHLYIMLTLLTRFMASTWMALSAKDCWSSRLSIRAHGFTPI